MNRILCVFDIQSSSWAGEFFEGSTEMFTTTSETEAIQWLSGKIFDNWKDRQRNTDICLGDSIVMVNGYSLTGYFDGDAVDFPPEEEEVMKRVVAGARDHADDRIAYETNLKKVREENRVREQLKNQTEAERATYERLRKKFASEEQVTAGGWVGEPLVIK